MFLFKRECSFLYSSLLFYAPALSPHLPPTAAPSLNHRQVCTPLKACLSLCRVAPTLRELILKWCPTPHLGVHKILIHRVLKKECVSGYKSSFSSSLPRQKCLQTTSERKRAGLAGWNSRRVWESGIQAGSRKMQLVGGSTLLGKEPSISRR